MLLFTLGSLAGCQSSGYRAANLPAKYRVAEKKKDTALNLGRLAGAGLGTTQLAPGDLVEVTIATGREREQVEPILARVDDDGAIDLPLIGTVAVASLEPFEAARNVAAAGIERGIYRRPHVTLDVKTRATNKITVLGAVETPGTYEIPRGACDLAAALGAAGGLTEEASREVDLLRQGTTFMASSPENAPGDGVSLAAHQQVYGSGSASGAGQRLARIDLAATPEVADDERLLNDRDVVFALPREKEVLHVAGLVNTPGQFDLPHDQDVHLLDAVAMAGGLKSPVADKVLVIRRPPGKAEPVVIRASLTRAKRNNLENIRLASGDMVSIERTPVTIMVDSFNHLFRMSFGLSSRAALF